MTPYQKRMNIIDVISEKEIIIIKKVYRSEKKIIKTPHQKRKNNKVKTGGTSEKEENKNGISELRRTK